MTTDVNTIISLRLDMISQIDENCFANNIFFFLKCEFIEVHSVRYNIRK